MPGCVVVEQESLVGVLRGVEMDGLHHARAGMGIVTRLDGPEATLSAGWR